MDFSDSRNRTDDRVVHGFDWQDLFPVLQNMISQRRKKLNRTRRLHKRSELNDSLHSRSAAMTVMERISCFSLDYHSNNKKKGIHDAVFEVKLFRVNHKSSSSPLVASFAFQWSSCQCCGPCLGPLESYFLIWYNGFDMISNRFLIFLICYTSTWREIRCWWVSSVFIVYTEDTGS